MSFFEKIAEKLVPDKYKREFVFLIVFVAGIALVVLGLIIQYVVGVILLFLGVIAAVFGGIEYFKFYRGKYIKIKPGTTYIDSHTIMGPQTNTDKSKRVEEVLIPDSVTKIDDAFSMCYNLKTIVIPNSVKEIGSFAFSHSGLQKIEIPNGVVSIGDGAFSGCKQLADVTIPESVESVGDNAFKDCEELSTEKKKELITRFGLHVIDKDMVQFFNPTDFNKYVEMFGPVRAFGTYVEDTLNTFREAGLDVLKKVNGIKDDAKPDELDVKRMQLEVLGIQLLFTISKDRLIQEWNQEFGQNFEELYDKKMSEDGDARQWIMDRIHNKKPF